MTERHVASAWEAIADALPQRIALAHGERSVSWRDFENRAARLAGALGAHGIGPGATAAIDLYNCPEYLEIFFGVTKTRAAPANVNYRYLDDELAQLLADAQAQAIFVHASLAERIAGLRRRLPQLRLCVQVDEPGRVQQAPPGFVAYEALLAAHPPAPRIERRASDTFLSYTGGTTGLPKGVMVSLGRIMEFQDEWLSMMVGEALPKGLDDAARARHLEQRGLCPVGIPASPQMHSTGLQFSSLPVLNGGGTVVTLESRSFDAHELLRTIARRRATAVAIVGDALARPIARALDERRAQGQPYDTASLRVIMSAGVAFSAETKDRLFAHIPHLTIFDGAGATEGCTYGTRLLKKGDPTHSANFVAAPGLKLLDENGGILPSQAGQVGLLANLTYCTGYYRDPQKSAKTYRTIDGDLYTVPGDYGRLEPDGTLTLLGRGTSTINTGGEKVHPEEVEHVIKALAGAEDCLVLGLPDERFGQRIVAVVQRAPGALLDTSAVIAGVRERLAGYKAPKAVVFVERAPRAPNGKPDYAGARELARAALQASA
jgi:fatty-acyl-CoA synthase